MRLRNCDTLRRTWLWHEERPVERKGLEEDEPAEPEEPEYPAWLLRLLGV